MDGHARQRAAACGHVDNRGNLNLRRPCLSHNLAPGASGPEHDQAPSGERAVQRDSGREAPRPHDAGPVPTRECEAEIAPAGRDDQSVESNEPRARLIGEPEHRTWQRFARRSLDEDAPRVDAEPYIDAGIECRRQLRARGHDVLEHASLIVRRGAHALTEHPRHIDPHQRRGDRMLINEQRSQSEPRRLDRRRDAGRPGPDHDERHMLGDGEALAGDGGRINR